MAPRAALASFLAAGKFYDVHGVILVRRLIREAAARAKWDRTGCVGAGMMMTTLEAILPDACHFPASQPT
jgi:hypothetical protein